MTAHKDERKKNFLLQIAVLAVFFLLLWLAFRYLLGLVMPFLIGYLIAALVQPAVRALHKNLKMNRRAAGIVTVLFLLLLVALLLSVFITKAVGELAAVAGQLPILFEQLAASVERMSRQISLYIDSLPVDYAQKAAAALQSLSAELMKLSSISSGTVTFAFNLASRVPGLMLDVIVTVVSACFMSMDYGDIRGFVLRQLPMRWQETVCDLKGFMFNTMAKLMRAYMTLMLITFGELCVGLGLMRVQHFIAIAAVIAVVDLMPVLGTGTVMIPWAVIELMLGAVPFAAALAVLYGVIMVVRNILEPKIVGHHIGLYPLVSLMAMFIGLKLFGFAGMILFPIIVIVLKHMQETGRLHLWND